MSASISTTLPGAAEKRFAPRCGRAAARAARGRSPWSTGCAACSSDERERASRASVVMRCAVIAGVGRHAVVGLAVPGREDQDLDLGRDEVQARSGAPAALRRRAPRGPARPARPARAAQAPARDRRRRARRNRPARSPASGLVASFEGVEGAGEGGCHWVGFIIRIVIWFDAKRSDPEGAREGVQPGTPNSCRKHGYVPCPCHRFRARPLRAAPE